MVKCILLHYTNLSLKQLIRHKFLKVISPEAIQENQQDDIKLGQMDNQRLGTGLSHTGPRFHLLIVVVKVLFKLML